MISYISTRSTSLVRTEGRKWILMQACQAASGWTNSIGKLLVQLAIHWTGLPWWRSCVESVTPQLCNSCLDKHSSVANAIMRYGPVAGNGVIWGAKFKPCHVLQRISSFVAPTQGSPPLACWVTSMANWKCGHLYTSVWWDGWAMMGHDGPLCAPSHNGSASRRCSTTTGLTNAARSGRCTASTFQSLLRP